MKSVCVNYICWLIGDERVREEFRSRTREVTNWRIYSTIFRPAIQQFDHEANVGDGQSKGLNAGQPFLVSERRNLSPEFVEGFIQIEHPSSFTNIGSSPLGEGGHAPSGFLMRYGCTVDT